MKKHNIVDIRQGSIASEVGIQKGDHLLSVNGKEMIDFLDYEIENCSDQLELEIESKGIITIYDIEKDPFEDLGLIFENELMDKPRSCQNKCIFCFIDQLPADMRKTLYFKDDDIRMSFLNGNYVTLTNLDDKELKRIIDHKLSPINISIHSTNIETRIKLLGNKKAGNILHQIKLLLSNNIEINAQFVIVKDINDKDDLKKSFDDLLQLEKPINSISVVPVGITKFRDNIASIDKDTSRNVIDIVDRYRKMHFDKYKKNIIYASDEFYIKAGMQLPDTAYYEEFPQIENGVGLVRSFCEDFTQLIKSKKYIKSDRSFSIITSESFYEYIVKMTGLIDNDIKVHKIINKYFGETVTVAGLLTFADITEQLKYVKINDIVLLPEEMFKQDEDLTLDGHSSKDIEEMLRRKVIVIKNGAKGLFEILFEDNKGED